ncbi:MAG TPA: hypothetical protein VH331_06420 [Allosphingosinicella sp.]|jgi:hypothetical protein|nr:hypothetical protein [Allosphingosinicella sp.]
MRKAVLLLCAGLASAAAGPAAFDPARIAGRYSHHFLNGLVDGSKYWSDDVLEIVPLDSRRAYFRAELQFYNGHQCSIFGVARAEPGGLVYREPEANTDGGRCVLHIRETRTGVRLADDQSCRDHCGARGSLNGDDFDRKSRRPITYLDRLKGSSEYRDALAEDRGEKTK